MVHSVYSNKEIFLRELISNSSDALDKRRYESISNPALESASELEIRIEADPAARTLSIIDNGIGMSRDEVHQYHRQIRGPRISERAERKKRRRQLS